MMQSAPFTYRRLIIWIGRLVLGVIFLYAGVAKLTMPNTHLWPWFVLKFSVATNLGEFTKQVHSYQLLSGDAASFVGHTLPFAEIVIGLALLIGWGLRFWASLVTLIMLGFLGAVTRAYLLHLDIDCGCFGVPEKLTGLTIVRDAAISALALLMTYFVFTESKQPHAWSAASEKTA